MYVLVAYDVSTETKEGKKRLAKVAKECEKYGQRVQNSVFECLLDPGQYKLLKRSLENIISFEKDNIRFYNLGKNWTHRVESIGKSNSYNPKDPFIF